VGEDFRYSSDNNTEWLSKETLLQIINDTEPRHASIQSASS
jgi:hypothetical protein